MAPPAQEGQLRILVMLPLAVQRGAAKSGAEQGHVGAGTDLPGLQLQAQHLTAAGGACGSSWGWGDIRSAASFTLIASSMTVYMNI